MNPKETAIWNRLDKNRLPQHIGIIMDGNGRWAKKKIMPRVFGHRAGVKTVDRIVTMATEINLKALTLYSFSSENWSRPEKEVDALMQILREFLSKEKQRMIDNNIRFNVIGRLSDMPKSALDYINDVKTATAHCHGTILTLALSYGGQDELLDAAKGLARRVEAGEATAEQLTKADFAEQLYTKGLPELDLLIRTSGELRISNFLLWQIAYAELYFTKSLWPDFSTEDFLLAIEDYQSRERRFGLSGEQLRQEQ